MGRVVPYRRGNRPWRPSDSRRQRAEKSRSPFTPLYMLVIVSALGLVWYNFGERVQHRTAHALVGGADPQPILDVGHVAPAGEQAEEVVALSALDPADGRLVPEEGERLGGRASPRSAPSPRR